MFICVVFICSSSLALIFTFKSILLSFTEKIIDYPKSRPKVPTTVTFEIISSLFMVK